MASRFIDALLASPLPIIMEVKRSDGEGAELMGDRTDRGDRLAVRRGGAPCISVVTGRWFGGNDQMLRDVAGLTDLPLLKKDFITREKQIVAAKEMGASAVLLTAKILPCQDVPAPDRDHARARADPVRRGRRPGRARQRDPPGDCIIAVNNKDINTREREPGDIDTSRSLLEATIESGTPCPVQRQRDPRSRASPPS